MDVGDGQSSAIPLSVFIKDNLGIIILLALFVLLSAYFSCSETTYSAASKLRLKTRSDKGSKISNRALFYVENFEETISIILLGNNLVNMATAAISAIIAIRAGMSETKMTIIVTLIVIIFGEILPKTIAKARANSLSLAFAVPMRFFELVLWPINFVFKGISKGIAKIFEGSGSPEITEEDVRDIIEDIDEEGKVDSDEVNLLYSAFEFDGITVGDIYKEGKDTISINLDNDGPKEILSLIRKYQYSRMPVYRGNPENIIGILRLRTFLEEYVFNGNTKIEEMLDEPLYTDINDKADDLLKIMQDKAIHMAIVKENGSNIGIITLEDLLEELVGEIFDESDNKEESFKKLSENEFEISADLSCVSAFELMEFENFDREECGHETLRDWAEGLMEGKPKKGAEFEYNNLTIRVNKVLKGQASTFIFQIGEEEEEDKE